METRIHATLRKNLPSIRKNGLRCNRSRGKIKGVWLAKCNNERYVISHMLDKRKAALYDVVIIRVRVNPATLKNHNSGFQYSLADIPPSAICGVKSFLAVEESTW